MPGVIREIVWLGRPDHFAAILDHPGSPCDIVVADRSGVVRSVVPDSGLDVSLFGFQRIEWRSFDGVPIDCWRRTSRRPKGAVIAFHGGPALQARPRQSSTFDALVAAGFEVFDVNVRGSAGRGEHYRGLDDGPLRVDAVRDALYATDLIAELTEGVRLCVLGVSYGALLAANVVASRDFVQSGVGISGLYDLEDYMSTTGGSRIESIEEYGVSSDCWKAVTPKLDSPRAGRMLIVHGGVDENVPIEHARRVASTWGCGVDFLTFDREGHGVHSAENKALLDGAVASWVSHRLNDGVHRE